MERISGYNTGLHRIHKGLNRLCRDYIETMQGFFDNCPSLLPEGDL